MFSLLVSIFYFEYKTYVKKMVIIKFIGMKCTCVLPEVFTFYWFIREYPVLSNDKQIKKASNSWSLSLSLCCGGVCLLFAYVTGVCQLRSVQSACSLFPLFFLLFKCHFFVNVKLSLKVTWRTTAVIGMRKKQCWMNDLLEFGWKDMSSLNYNYVVNDLQFHPKKAIYRVK